MLPEACDAPVDLEGDFLLVAGDHLIGVLDVRTGLWPRIYGTGISGGLAGEWLDRGGVVVIGRTGSVFGRDATRLPRSLLPPAEKALLDPGDRVLSIAAEGGAIEAHDVAGSLLWRAGSGLGDLALAGEAVVAHDGANLQAFDRGTGRG